MARRRDGALAPSRELLVDVIRRTGTHVILVIGTLQPDVAINSIGLQGGLRHGSEWPILFGPQRT
jgi:hypothetical protein